MLNGIVLGDRDMAEHSTVMIRLSAMGVVVPVFFSMLPGFLELFCLARLQSGDWDLSPISKRGSEKGAAVAG